MNKDANTAISAAMAIAANAMAEISLKDLKGSEKWNKESSKYVSFEIQALHQVANNAAVMLQTDNVRPDFRLCQCGTCKDAVDAALRLYVQLREHQCRWWVIQIATVLLEAGKSEAGAGMYLERQKSPEKFDGVTEDQMSHIAGASTMIADTSTELFQRMFHVLLISQHTDTIMTVHDKNMDKYS